MNAKKEESKDLQLSGCRISIANHFSNHGLSDCHSRNAVIAANAQHSSRTITARAVQRRPRVIERRIECSGSYLDTSFSESVSTRTFYLRVVKIRTLQTKKTMTGTGQEKERLLAEQKT